MRHPATGRGQRRVSKGLDPLVTAWRVGYQHSCEFEKPIKQVLVQYFHVESLPRHLSGKEEFETLFEETKVRVVERFRMEPPSRAVEFPLPGAENHILDVNLPEGRYSGRIEVISDGGASAYVTLDPRDPDSYNTSPEVAMEVARNFNPEIHELSQNRALWDSWGFTDYDYRSDIRCFCGFVADPPLDFVVREGELGKVTTVGLGDTISPNQWTQSSGFSTIESFFDRLERILARRPDSFTVNYHPKYGFPMSADLDPSSRTSDHELQFTISDFEPTGEDAVSQRSDGADRRRPGRDRGSPPWRAHARALGCCRLQRAIPGSLPEPLLV